MTLAVTKWLRWTLLGVSVGSTTLRGAPSMWVSSATALPGTTVQVAVNYAPDTNTPSLQLDLTYSPDFLTNDVPVPGDALTDQVMASSQAAPGDLRMYFYSFSNSSLVPGTLLTVGFRISPDAPDHDESLSLSNVIVDTVVAGNVYVVPVTLTNGVLSVVVPPQFTAVYRNSSGGIHLQLAGGPGRSYVIGASTNIALPQPWPALLTNVDTSSVREIDDASAASLPKRFYRARLTP